MASLYKGGKAEIQNYRPITQVNIIYKIWGVAMAGELSVIMNIIKTELQTAYKGGRSTLDILSIINKQIKTDATKHIIMLDISQAFGSVNREIRWAIVYKKGIPRQLIQRIRMGHENTKIRPKPKGNLGKRQDNNN